MATITAKDLAAAKTGTNLPGSFNATYKAPTTTKSSGSSGGVNPPPAPKPPPNTATNNTGNYYAAAPPPVDTAAIAAFDQQINFLNQGLGRADAARNSGFSGVDAQWQNALNALLAGKNQTETDVNASRKSLADQFIGAKNTIGYNSGNALNGILRLLGSRGAGGSSTAKVAVPGAVAREATLQRNEVAGTNADNNRNVDSSWQKYLLGYDREVNSANTQRTNARDQINRQIEENKANILQQIAALAGKRSSAARGNAVGAMQPYLDQASAALNRASNYSVAPINYNTQAYTAPELSKYLVDPGPAPSVQGETQSNDYVSPYYAGLLGLTKEKAATA